MRNMSAYGVKGQCGVSGLNINNFAERHKAKLDKCLEAVADTQHKTVTVFKKLVYGVGNSGISEGCSPPEKPPGSIII